MAEDDDTSLGINQNRERIQLGVATPYAMTK